MIGLKEISWYPSITIITITLIISILYINKHRVCLLVLQTIFIADARCKKTDDCIMRCLKLHYEFKWTFHSRQHYVKKKLIIKNDWKHDNNNYSAFCVFSAEFDKSFKYNSFNIQHLSYTVQ